MYVRNFGHPFSGLWDGVEGWTGLRLLAGPYPLRSKGGSAFMGQAPNTKAKLKAPNNTHTHTHTL